MTYTEFYVLRERFIRLDAYEVDCRHWEMKPTLASTISCNVILCIE